MNSGHTNRALQLKLGWLLLDFYRIFPVTGTFLTISLQKLPQAQMKLSKKINRFIHLKNSFSSEIL